MVIPQVRKGHENSDVSVAKHSDKYLLDSVIPGNCIYRKTI